MTADSDNSTPKIINNLLNSPKTRLEGLIMLDSHLPECSDEDFIECCGNWMQNCCKTNGFSKDVNFPVEMLKKLFKISANYSELNKSVSFFIMNRFFDHFFKYFVNSDSGWECAKTCFSLYRGPCGPSLENIEMHLLSNLKKNVKISSDVSECFALLPSLGGGGNEGINYQANWKKQFVKYICITHSILNDMFADVEEFQEYDTSGHMYDSGKRQPSFDYLTIQLYNHCSILNSMLVNSFPAPKCIATDMVLELICRGLAINSKSLRNTKTTALISLQKTLPEVHVILHDLLNALIATCGSQLLPYSFLICKLIKQTLEWSQSEFVYGSEKSLGFLRIAAYDTMCNWLVAAKSGSCIETFAKLIISHIISDIESKKTVVLLKESKSKKRLSNTKQLSSSRRIDPSANACLCYAALQALQYLLKFSGVLLKLEDHKYLQETIVKLLVGIQNSFPTEVLVPYSDPVCRKGLYSVLLELVNQPCPKWPPPTHFAFRIFKKGENDSSPQVTQFCTTALNALAVIIHQQFSNGPFLTTETMNDEKQNQANESFRDELMEVEDEAVGDDVTVEEGGPVNSDTEGSNENKSELKSTSLFNHSSHALKIPSPKKFLMEEECSRSDDEISERGSSILGNKDLLQESEVVNDEDECFQETNQIDDEPKSKISEDGSSFIGNKDLLQESVVANDEDECFQETNQVDDGPESKKSEISEDGSSFIHRKDLLQESAIVNKEDECFQEANQIDDELISKKSKISEDGSSILCWKDLLQESAVVNKEDECFQEANQEDDEPRSKKSKISKGGSNIVGNKDLLQESAVVNKEDECFQEANQEDDEPISKKSKISEDDSSIKDNKALSQEDAVVNVEDECFQEENQIDDEPISKKSKISEDDSSIKDNKALSQEDAVVNVEDEWCQESDQVDDESNNKNSENSENKLIITTEPSITTKCITSESNAEKNKENDSFEKKETIIAETMDNDLTIVPSEKTKNGEKSLDVNGSEDSNSENSISPELAGEERKQMDFKKRYFLRSKTHSLLSEETEESLKRADSIDSLRCLGRNTPTKSLGRNTPTKSLGRNTPTKSLGRNTPTKSLGRTTPTSAISSSRRQRTRVSSKLAVLEDESELKELKDSKRIGRDDGDNEDDDDDILETFDETFAE